MKLAATAISILVAFLLAEVDLVALRILAQDARSWLAPDAVVEEVKAAEPKDCQRLRGPIGAEDAVLLDGNPPIIVLSELDAGVHEFTNIKEHGTCASTSPPGTLWAIDQLSTSSPRLIQIDVPLPANVSTMHTHGLAVRGDVLYAVNHAFRGGGERIERWRISRHGGGEGTASGAAPISLTHIGAFTGHDSDEEGGAWTFTERLHAGINAVTPASDPDEVFFSQFMDGPAHLDGGGSGVAAPPDADLLGRAYRAAAQWLGVPVHASILMRRLHRTRIWHCYCAAVATGDGGACGRTACHPVGPPSTKWNGIAFKPSKVRTRVGRGSGSAGSGGELDEMRGWLYVNDIFRRVTVEFEVHGDGRRTRLEQAREFRLPHMVDNVRLDTEGTALWIGAVGHSHPNFFAGLRSLVANASAAHTSAVASSLPTPRPHLHLRPSLEAPPQPPMLSGVLRIDLASGAVHMEAMQASLLASISWGLRIGGKLFFGSPWDDGVVVCRL